MPMPDPRAGVSKLFDHHKGLENLAEGPEQEQMDAPEWRKKNHLIYILICFSITKQTKKKVNKCLSWNHYGTEP